MISPVPKEEEIQLVVDETDIQTGKEVITMTDDDRERIRERLWAMHQELTNYLLKLLREGLPEKQSAQMLTVMRQFLADNGITLKNAPTRMKTVEEYLEELKDFPYQ